LARVDDNHDHFHSSFWHQKSIDDLACEQGIQPIRSLDELAGDWPDEDSLHEFLGLLREIRR
jgi:hypothetical protein